MIYVPEAIEQRLLLIACECDVDGSGDSNAA